MIEHVMQAVMSLAQQVWVLAQGQLIAEGNPQAVTSNPAVVEAYLGHGTAERLRKAAEKAAQGSKAAHAAQAAQAARGGTNQGASA
jgi:branched-chain amino acid transport system ATP-binding protein